MVASIRVVREEKKHNRALGRAALNTLFRAGAPPRLALNGRYSGSLTLLDLAPGLTQLGEVITAGWLPWQGKMFDSDQRTGVNIFTYDSLGLARLFNPFYRGFEADGPHTYRAFTFRTSVGPGLFDTDRQVFKIDYDLPANPSLIRHVLDELVEIEDGEFLGKAHFKWGWGRWQTVAYFTLIGGGATPVR